MMNMDTPGRNDALANEALQAAAKRSPCLGARTVRRPRGTVSFGS